MLVLVLVMLLPALVRVALRVCGLRGRVSGDRWWERGGHAVRTSGWCEQRITMFDIAPEKRWHWTLDAVACGVG